jgi:tetratricopeptide (TPR) repeat protein
MSEIRSSFIERYQKIIEKDPKSKIFAPLAEAYRKMGLLREAKTLCEQGLKWNPGFSGGSFALAKILVDMGDLAGAMEHLEQVAESTPENLSAQLLLGETCLKLKEPKKALKAFKMVLFVNPGHERAVAAIRRLESLTADEYDEDVFAIAPLKQAAHEVASDDSGLDVEPIGTAAPSSSRVSQLERYVSLVDALLARSDIDRAQDILAEAERELGSHPEVVKRLRFIKRFEERDAEEAEPIAPEERPEDLRRSRRLNRLRSLLARVRDREMPSPDPDSI